MVVETGGGDRGTRTPNLGIANAALSQLSYIPTWVREQNYSTVADRGGQAPRRSKLRVSMASGREFGVAAPARNVFARLGTLYVILRRAYEAAHAPMNCVPNS